MKYFISSALSTFSGSSESMVVNISIPPRLIFKSWLVRISFKDSTTFKIELWPLVMSAKRNKNCINSGLESMKRHTMFKKKI